MPLHCRHNYSHMAFKATPNQSYHLIVKHTGMALAFTSDEAGADLCQMEYDPINKRQWFRFDAGNNYYWILTPPYKERYMAVNDSAMHHGARIIQWHWEPNKLNNRFRFEPAGDGYYRIRVLHSNHYLDVYHGDKASGAKVRQSGLSTTDNQLFMPVPVTDEPLDGSPKSYKQVDEIVRTGVIGLIGGIPKAGGVLSFIVGHFWTEHDKLADLWNQMKIYVDNRISEVLEKVQLDALRAALAGQMAKVARVNDMKARRGEAIEHLITDIIGIEPFFFKQRTDVVPYLLGLGSISVSLHHLLVNNYEELFGHPPTSEEVVHNIEQLRLTVKKYYDEVERQRKVLMERRMSYIYDWDYLNAFNFKMDSPAGIHPTNTARVRDLYDSWIFLWNSEDDPGPNRDRYRIMADNATAQRREQIKVQYAAELDAYLRPAKYWRYYLPDAPSFKTTRIRKNTGAYGGIERTHQFTYEEGKNLIGVDVYTDVYLKDLVGLVVFYNDGSSQQMGLKSGYRQQLRLAADEYITSVYGYMNYNVDGIWFSTQKGRTVGVGKTRNLIFFSADLPDVFNPGLIGLSGAHNGYQIEQLTFHWEYED